MRRRPVPESSGGGELNLVPYLDIIVNLVMFLLLTTQMTADLKMLVIRAPGVCPGCASTEDAGVVVAIARDGYHVLGDGPWSGTIHRTTNGELDVQGLNAHLVAAARGIDTLPGLTVTADDDAEYGAVVATIDAVRSAPDGRDLFPSVALGKIGG